MASRRKKQGGSEVPAATSRQKARGVCVSLLAELLQTGETPEAVPMLRQVVSLLDEEKDGLEESGS
jgi:hypothetical protein